MKSSVLVMMVLILSLANATFAAGPNPTAKSTPPDTNFRSSSGITDSADKTKGSNSSGQMLNTAMGAINLSLAAACASSCPKGSCCPMSPLYLLMGLQNIAQSKAQGGTAGQASRTVGQTDIGTSGYDPEAVKKLEKDLDLKKGLDFVASVTNADLTKAPFSYNPATQTVTAPNGKTLKAKDVNSPEAMAAAGVSQGIIDGVSAATEQNLALAMKKVAKYMKTPVNGEEYASGGGGSASDGSSTSAASAGAGAGSGSGSGAREGLGVDRDPAQVAGMQKNYHGEPIGVSADSIFNMMTRRYRTKDSQNSFLDESELLIQK